MKRYTAVILLLWMFVWAGVSLYGAVANVPVIQGVVGGTPLPIQQSSGGDTVQAGTLAANNATLQFTTGGRSVFSFQALFSGTWNASLICEVSNTGLAADWGQVCLVDVYDQWTLFQADAPYAAFFTVFQANVAGFQYVRLRSGSYTAGNVVITAAASSNGPTTPFLFYPNLGDYTGGYANATIGYPGEVGLYYDAGNGFKWSWAAIYRSPPTAGIANSQPWVLQTNANRIYNSSSTNWDSEVSANSAANTTGTGLVGAGMMVWDGTNWQRYQGDAPNSFLNLAALGTTTIKSGAGTLHTVTINALGTADTATIYDNTAGSGTKVATINTTLSQGTLTFDAHFTTGLTVVIAGGAAPDITFNYQ